MTVVALLDDRDASETNPTSRLYTGFLHQHWCDDPAALDAIWAEVEADQRAGHHALLLIDYEWGARLLKAGHERLGADAQGALRVLMFARCERLSREAATRWLAAQPDGDGPAGTMDLRPSVDRAQFRAAIERIHEAIAAGETYQVNYTYRLHGRAFGTPLALYRALRERQPVAYGAYVVLPDGGTGGGATHVLSCSPELFVRGERGLVTAKPMKGTASRIAAPEGDSETARLLSLDTKNRAENLMIVDLLRNDLGRVAEIGSVKVPELFAIEPYSTVFQMTSTVQARLRPSVGMPELLRAIYPCGSITGAPKHHTMQLIAGLESTPRGLYCGAIGWADAPREDEQLGNFCLSVAIRTLTLGSTERGSRPLRLGVGAGIVKDSVADDEFEECRLKARFLTGLAPGFELFETVLCTAAGELPHLMRHLARLQHSAQVLGFALDPDAAGRRLEAAAREPGQGGARRLRLALAHDGRLTITQAPLAPLPAGEVGLCLSTQRLLDADPLRAHKTTHRAAYDAGVREAERQGAFDSLFFSEGGWLVEGGRTSVFLKLDGRWVTPPLADGALPGVMRAVLLDDAALGAAERRLGRDELMRAEAIMVCNALRGALPARLLPPEGAR